MTEQEFKEIVSLYQEEGVSVCELTRRYSYSQPKIRKWLVKAGVEIRGIQDTNVTTIDTTIILEMYAAGKSMADIAKHFGCCRMTIKKRLDANNAITRKRKFPTDGEAKLMMELYKDGESPYKISKKMGFSPDCVRNHVIRLGNSEGFSLRGRNRITNDMITYMIADYNNGLSMGQIADKYQVSPSRTQGLLKLNGVNVRDSSVRNRKYSFNENVFDDITPTSAYWVGFLMADGCIYHRNGSAPRLTLGLAGKDFDHMEKFKKFMCSNHPLVVINSKLEGKQFKKISLELHSQKLASRLAEFGVIPNKSLTAEVYGLQMDRDFWRGAIDGDGCLGIYPNRLKPEMIPKINFLGSKRMTEQFREFVEGQLGMQTPSILRRRNIWSLTLSFSKAVQVISLLYKDATVSLSRKMAIAEKIMQKFSI